MRPHQPQDQRYAFAYLFGAVCPERDKGAALVMPCVNHQAMTLHLEEISRHVDEDSHAVLVHDRAGWHTTEKLKVPDDITRLPLPSRSPELNPTDNIWQYLRQTHLSNRVFDDYDHIVEACCDAWNSLLENSRRIRFIASRSWARVLVKNRFGWYNSGIVALGGYGRAPLPELPESARSIP